MASLLPVRAAIREHLTALLGADALARALPPGCVRRLTAGGVMVV